MPKVTEFLFGKKEKTKQLKTVSPLQEQLMALINQGLTSGQGPLNDLFGAFNKEEFEKGVTQPALQQFRENVLPVLQEKFIAGNQVGGSGQRQEFGKAGADLQAQLAQLMYQAQQQQKQNKLAGINSVLGKQSVENVIRGGTEGLVPGVIKGFATGAGHAAGTAIAG